MAKLTYYTNKFYSWIRQIFKKNEVKTINHFNPLTPTENAEDCEIYLESIEWALKNKSTIRNIAISGTYGSGKSSIIKTFIKRITESESFFKRKFKPTYKFLNISLATFKDNVNIPEPKDKDLLRLIELSILQQLFFHEKNHKTPDSRFKKIKKESTWKLVLYTCLTLFSLLSILYLFFPNIFQSISIISSIKVDSIVVRYIASSIIIISVFLLILKSSRGLLSASIKKLNINNAEIEIDKGISKSILNNHLDEIIYFFEATKYNVVIIEDLDRFEQTEVFTKLREINLLINNSNKIRRDVVFIYAIKDDMFVDKDRAKFFDFMIPIIPVIDYSNSSNKLLKIIQQNNYNISHDLIDDLSMFIDDMRLLYNIMNEFYIYYKRLGQSFQNQLLAMIVYKNIFPNDFTKLSQNEGNLYNAINKKQDYVKNLITDIDTEILNIKEKIEIKNEQKLINQKELRSLYILALINDIKSTGFLGFNINGKLVNSNVLCEDKYFQNLFAGSVDYFFRFNSRNESNNHKFNFEDIENVVDSKYTYKQREELLDKNKTIELKNEIKRLTEEKNEVQKYKIKDLLSNKQIVVTIESDKLDSETKKKNDLINILLRNGYIDENYTDYISIFHEGALTKSDYQFLINVKKEETTEYSYNITKKEELLKKIDDFAFEKPYIFNHGLIDFLLKSKNNEKKKEFLLKQLSNETSESISFIDEHLDNSVVVEVFIKNLCHYWTNIWNYIHHNSQYTNERIDRYFRLIIQHADVDDIKKIFENEYDYLTNYSDFLNIPPVKKGRLEQIIKTLDLKFISIDINSPKPLLEYLFKNDYYDFNVEIFRTLMSINNEFEADEFETANYGYILSKGFDCQIKYIHSEIDEYVQYIYLQLENNTKEKLEHYIQLLNHPNLDIDFKEEVIEQVETIIDDVSEIVDKDVVDLFFKHSKVKASWDNVLHSYEREENKFSDGLIEYLNTLSNAELLSKEEMAIVKVGDKQKYDSICDDIIYENRINSKSYKLLLKSIPWWYEEFDSEKLSKDRIAILIETENVNPTISSYQFLKDNFDGTNILLLEKYMEEFDGKINEITIDSSDLNLVLKSTKLSSKYKFYILNNCDEDIVTEKSENLELIAQLLVDNESYSISDDLKLSIITEKSILQKNRLLLFNRNINLIRKSMLDDFLTSMGGDYALITNTSKKAILEDKTMNRKLLENLIKLGYISTYSEKEKGLIVNHKRKH